MICEVHIISNGRSLYIYEIIAFELGLKDKHDKHEPQAGLEVRCMKVDSHKMAVPIEYYVSQ